MRNSMQSLVDDSHLISRFSSNSEIFASVMVIFFITSILHENINSVIYLWSTNYYQ